MEASVECRFVYSSYAVCKQENVKEPSLVLPHKCASIQAEWNACIATIACVVRDEHTSLPLRLPQSWTWIPYGSDWLQSRYATVVASVIVSLRLAFEIFIVGGYFTHNSSYIAKSHYLLWLWLSTSGWVEIPRNLNDVSCAILSWFYAKFKSATLGTNMHRWICGISMFYIVQCCSRYSPHALELAKYSQFSVLNTLSEAKIRSWLL